MENKFNISTSYWGTYKMSSIHLNDYNSSCRLTIYNDRPHVAFISDMYVDENYRGKGKGNELLSECHRLAKEFGCTSLELICRYNQNDQVKNWDWVSKWYERNGFRKMTCDLFMSKSLDKEYYEPDNAKAPTLVGQDYSENRCGYKIPAGYEFDSIRNDEIILKPKSTSTPSSIDPNAEHY